MRRKVLIVAVLILSILLQSILPFTVVNATTSVEITLNSNLYKAIKSQLEIKGIVASYMDANGKIIISSDELEKVTSLDLSNSGIDDLTGLSAFSNLVEVNLTANELTIDSNLNELDSLNLVKLNLSSNKIESVNSITKFDSIQYTDITNQEINKKEVISVDISEESSYDKTVTVTLPDILLKDTGAINPDWIDAEVDGDASVAWASSITSGTTDLVLNVAQGNGDNYSALKGLVKVIVNVNDSESKLANTKMTFYYVIVDSDETGIIFEDENLYKAVKEQLTKGQNINDELESYGTTGTTLYARAYDDALILVIDTNTLINKIPSLILNDKKIKDLTGIEEFVGLETNLNVSYNYIDTIQRILDLENNKDIKERELQERFNKILQVLKNNKSQYDTYCATEKALQEQISAKNEELAAIDPTDPAKAEERLAKANEISELMRQLSEAQEKKAIYKSLITKSEVKLYKIYEKEYKVISLLPIEVNKVSYEDLLETNLATAKGYAESTMDKISNLEQSESLSAFENSALIEELKKWASSHGLTFNTERTAEVDGVTQTFVIENPISEFFDIIKQNPDFFTATDYQQLVYIFKCTDALSQLREKVVLKLVFDELNDSDINRSFIEDELREIIDFLNSKELDTTIYSKIIYNNACTTTEQDGTTAGFHIYETSNPLYNYHEGFSLAGINLSDAYLMQLAGKLSKVTNEDITTYITLPRIQELIIRDNKIDTLAGIEALDELKGLDAYKNLLDDISDVNWSSLKLLKALSLGYNQISNIKPLEVLTNLIELDLSRNLLSGNFDFYLVNMKDLEYADFSHNQYTNIASLRNQYALIAKSMGLTAEEFLMSDFAPEINFQYQYLTMSTTVIKTGDFITLELPKIFAQFEQIDHDRTSYGITSNTGSVLADGTAVKLMTPTTGNYRSTVTVEGKNGYNSYSTMGFGYGTTCVIDYNVIDEPADPVNPTDPGEPSIPVVPDLPEDLEVGYKVEEGYVYVYTPETTLADFSSRLVDLDNYDISITNNVNTNKISTGAVVSIDTKAGENVAILEVVVKGDVNGDGEIDALDSGIIRNVIKDTTSLVGVYEAAADVNDDSEIDTLDALLVLRYRADKISSFED